MHNGFSQFIFASLYFISSLFAQDRIQINIPTAQAEAAYVWRNIQDIAFFEEHGYDLSLPKGALIDSLITKVKANQLSENDFPALQRFMESQVYNRETYLAAYAKIENRKPLINEMIRELETIEKDWDFKSFDVYQVNLTLYGPGGSYNPDDGSILIYTTANGGFKNYVDPANTIIHEVIHIGIENAIVSAFNIPHPTKERIVDHFVLLNFKDRLPDYRMQNMGNTEIDSLLKEKKDLKQLAELLKELEILE